MGKKVPLNEVQKKVIWGLWQTGKRKIPPQVYLLSRLDEEDKKYILKVCGADYRPREFGDANALRLSSFRYFQEIGFSVEQSAVLTGMMFNMVGRRDL